MPRPRSVGSSPGSPEYKRAIASLRDLAATLGEYPASSPEHLRAIARLQDVAATVSPAGSAQYMRMYRGRARLGRALPSQLREDGRRAWASWFEKVLGPRREGSYWLERSPGVLLGRSRAELANSRDPYAECCRGSALDAVPVADTARALKVEPLYVRRLRDAKRGVSPDVAWEYGEALATLPGRQWCSGLASLAVAEEYRPHVLGWLGTLLADSALRKPFLQRASLLGLFRIACYGTGRATKLGMHLLRIDGARHKDGVLTHDISWVFTDDQRIAAATAWRRWTRYADPSRLPVHFQITISALRLTSDADPNTRHRLTWRSLESLCAYLMDEFSLPPDPLAYDAENDPVFAAMHYAPPLAAAMSQLADPYVDFVPERKEAFCAVFRTNVVLRTCDRNWVAGLIDDEDYLAYNLNRPDYGRVVDLATTLGNTRDVRDDSPVDQPPF